MFILKTRKKTTVSSIMGENVPVVQDTQRSVSSFAAVTVIMKTKALKLLFSTFASKTPRLKQRALPAVRVL